MDYSKVVVVSPFSKPMRNGKRNPKDYPWWPELVGLVKEKGFDVVQVGVAGETKLTDDFRPGLRLRELRTLIGECRTWISVDNFLHHLAASVGKPGVVLWGKGDPIIFGHASNHNLLKSRSFLRKNQFDIWETEEYDPDVFIGPEEVMKYVE